MLKYYSEYIDQIIYHWKYLLLALFNIFYNYYLSFFEFYYISFNKPYYVI